MTDTERKVAIQSAIHALGEPDFAGRARALFAALGYDTGRQSPLPEPTFAAFREAFLAGDARFNKAKALTDEWLSVDLLFQLSQDELSGQWGLLDTRRVDNTIIETYLFFAIELAQAEYSRTALAQITREVNKVFPMPALLAFKHGDHVTLAVINRRLSKKDEQKDVLEKVTVIKDIAIAAPHRAHVDILFDLSWPELQRVYRCTNFVELHQAWQKTLDTKELNQRFYRELSNWYFWAMDIAAFPDDVQKDREIRNATNLIRLLTRILFVWFIKEKHLVPDALFDPREMQRLLKGFSRDENSRSYYNAILQNLFFATLNQKIEERAFATDGDFEQKKLNYGIKNLYRYADRFTLDKKSILALFKDIPFLNGGLFDCLDKEDAAGKVLYEDGFSRNPKKQALLPDRLFFGDEQEVDLSAVYGDKKKAREKVKGLIPLLSAYKFTVTENTPIEEDVALDPELLGRVFENLLASYNPETQTTARKQTGSFYTPREIVEYMVDESLMAYLHTHLTPDPSPTERGETETRLRHLLAYNDAPHRFTAAETARLIEAIDAVKILDPAAGSGAFPMGILHKLVHILHKLDPQNAGWKERQLDKAMAIDDAVIRDNLIDDIETAFAHNELDYGRKLYLIENCIYGVDIQPIAVQISKLRFFISLIVDQKADAARENFGIRPLPNLETKFVAANTLIGIEKPETQLSLFDAQDVQALEARLKDVRHRLFSAKTPAAKRKLREEDKLLREKMGALLVAQGYGNESARQLAGWDPYDQNASSPFFDPEWMFGVSEGFDVVIGNPPYVRVDSIQAADKQQYKASYKTTKGKYDLYYLFFEHAARILGSRGVCTFITPNKFCAASSATDLRSILFSSYQSIEILSTSTLGVFEDAANYPIITILKRGLSEESLAVRQALSLEDLLQPSVVSYRIAKPLIKVFPESIIPINISQAKVSFLLNLLQKLGRLGDVFSISEGLRIPQSYETDSEKGFHIVKQYQFERYSNVKLGAYISEENFRGILSPGTDRYKKIFSDKIIIAEDALQITATTDFSHSIPQGGVYFGIPRNPNIKLQSILAVLNSSLLSFLYEILFGGMHMGGGYLRYRTSFLETLPFPAIPENIREDLYDKATRILAAKAADPAADVAALEAEIDRLVYQLYGLTEDEIAIVEGR